jgi:uncharacterized protein (DUF1499 family)
MANLSVLGQKPCHRIILERFDRRMLTQDIRPPSPVLPRVVMPDPQAQSAQAPVLARLVRGGAYHRQEAGRSVLAPAAEGLAYAAVPVALASVLLTRSGQVAPPQGILLLSGAIALAVAALGVGLVAGGEIWRRGRLGMLRLFRAALVSALVLAYPAYLAIQAAVLPVLNEISTDVNDPPVFSTHAHTIRARGGIRPGEASRNQRLAQSVTWPRLRTLNLEMEGEEAFSTVMDAVKTLKWQVTEQTRPDDARGRGRIEAVVYSRLMRLPQDVTIRFRWTGTFTRVDIRARSRFGRHDLGANAALIQRLLDEINTPSE